MDNATELQQIFAEEFNQLVQTILNIYIENRLFFIPNDIIEAIAMLLGLYLVDSQSIATFDLEKELTNIQVTLQQNAEKGYRLAEFFKEYQEQSSSELKTVSWYKPEELPIALLILDINLEVGNMLLTYNKQASSSMPLPETEIKMAFIIRQQLYPTLKNFTLDTVKCFRSTDFVIHKFSVYLGWLSGFYANLLESSLVLFVQYTFTCLESAIRQKLEH